MSQIETREIVADNNLALHHIYSQAGSIEKAFAECCTNAVDSRSTKIEITISDDGRSYVISDNGEGFETRDGILKNFEELGFDHNTEEELEKNRKFGRFGLGRAQLWCFSSNVWASGPFRMSVDLHNRGLEYDLDSNAEPVKGCTITGELYEPVSLAQVNVIRRELTELMRYMPIEIVFNGAVISKSMTKQTWDKVTDEAYYRLTDSGALKIYNMGMLVKSISFQTFGSGGIVVSRKPLTLNVARNDIMQNTCTVYPIIVSELRGVVEAKREKATHSFGTQDRIYLLREHVRADAKKSLRCMDKKIVDTSCGTKASLSQILKEFGGRITVTPTMYGSINERILEIRKACPIHSTMLQYLNMSADEFIEALNYHQDKTGGERFSLVAYEEVRAAIASTPVRLTDSQLTPKQKVAVQTLRTLNNVVSGMMSQVYDERYRLVEGAERQLELGKHFNRRAWTDANTYIAICAKTAVRLTEQGYRGLYEAACLILKQYLHTESTEQDDPCNHDILAAFHDISLELMEELIIQAQHLSISYGRDLIKAGLAVPKNVSADSEASIKAEQMREAIVERGLLTEAA